METKTGLAQSVIEGDADETQRIVQELLNTGQDAKTLLDTLVSAMDHVGDEWRVGNMFIPEVLIAARAMQEGMKLLRPLLSEADSKVRGTIIIGTVQGDLHDIGKSLVGMMIEGAGFQVIDLGVDVSPERFVQAVKKYQPDIVAMSTLLTTTISYMRDTIRSLEEAGLRNTVKVLVGGAPVTPEFALAIGSDGYAPDGATAVMKVRDLLGL